MIRINRNMGGVSKWMTIKIKQGTQNRSVVEYMSHVPLFFPGTISRFFHTLHLTRPKDNPPNLQVHVRWPVPNGHLGQRSPVPPGCQGHPLKTNISPLKGTIFIGNTSSNPFIFKGHVSFRRWDAKKNIPKCYILNSFLQTFGFGMLYIKVFQTWPSSAIMTPNFSKKHCNCTLFLG